MIRIMTEKWNQIYQMNIWKIIMSQATTYQDFLMKMKLRMMIIFSMMMKNIIIRKMKKMKKIKIIMIILKKLK